MVASFLRRTWLGAAASAMLAMAIMAGGGCSSQYGGDPAGQLPSRHGPTFDHAMRLFVLRHQLVGATKDELLQAFPDTSYYAGFASALPERGQESDLEAKEHTTPRHTFRNSVYEFRVNAFDRVMDIGLVSSDLANKVAKYLKDDYAGTLALSSCVLSAGDRVEGRLEWFSNLRASHYELGGLIVKRDPVGRILLVASE